MKTVKYILLGTMLTVLALSLMYAITWILTDLPLWMAAMIVLGVGYLVGKEIGE